MKLRDFIIGTDFIFYDKRWRCTDIGTRVVAAVCVSQNYEDMSWLKGPPYAIVEKLFDECCQQVCYPTVKAWEDAWEEDWVEDTTPSKKVRGKKLTHKDIYLEWKAEQEALGHSITFTPNFDNPDIDEEEMYKELWQSIINRKNATKIEEL